MENHRSRLGKEARRKQIVDSALNLFVEKGYKGTTTQEIAKSAGVSEVTLFRNFDSKKDIFMEGVVPVLMETLEENLNVPTFSIQADDLLLVERHVRCEQDKPILTVPTFADVDQLDGQRLRFVFADYLGFE